MSIGIKIAAAGNVEAPAYLSIKQKGYSVGREQIPEGKENWYAEKEGLHFIADGPIELLGIICVYETRGKD